MHKLFGLQFVSILLAGFVINEGYYFQYGQFRQKFLKGEVHGYIGDKTLFLRTGIEGVQKYENASARILLSENFDDNHLDERGWYDGTACRISGNSIHGAGCIEYEWIKGVQKVQGSSPQRHLIKPVEEFYIRYYLKLSKGWQWTGVNYHPHLTHFLTTENGGFDGPAATHLTLYIEPVNGKLRLGAQDIQNEHTPHGLTQGPLKGGYNGMLYDGKEVLFNDDQWHCIEAYFKLNSLDLKNDVPVKDGIIRGWFDGKIVIDHTDVVLRSADFPDMKFNQFLMAPYFGPGLLNNSQKLWIDELVISSKPVGPLPADGS